MSAQEINETGIYVIAIMEGILLCALQGIALRGHNEGSYASSPGNFKSLMTLLSCHLKVVKEQLQEKSVRMLPGYLHYFKM